MVTNKVVMEGDEGPVASHAEVLEAVQMRSVQMQSLVKGIIEVLSEDNFLEKIPESAPVSLYDGKFKTASPSPESVLKSETIIVGAVCLAAGILFGSLAKR
jgi:hypothetical protein